MQAQSDLAQGVRQLLAKPRLGLARRGEESVGSGRQHRRLLTADGVEEPSNEDVDPELPELKVGGWLEADTLRGKKERWGMLCCLYCRGKIL